MTPTSISIALILLIPGASSSSRPSRFSCRRSRPRSILSCRFHARANRAARRFRCSLFMDHSLHARKDASEASRGCNATRSPGGRCRAGVERDADRGLRVGGSAPLPRAYYCAPTHPIAHEFRTDWRRILDREEVTDFGRQGDRKRAGRRPRIRGRWAVNCSAASSGGTLRH